jgi:hypothetical protein
MKRRRINEMKARTRSALLSVALASIGCDEVYPIYPDDDCSGSQLLGVWQSFDGTVTFRADCTADVNWNSISGTGEYAQDDSRVSIFVNDETIVADVTNDTLALRDGSDDTSSTTLTHISSVVPSVPSPSGTTPPNVFDPTAPKVSLPELEQGTGDVCSAVVPCAGSLEGVWEHVGGCPDPSADDDEDWPTECQNRLRTVSAESSWFLTFRGEQAQSELTYHEVYTLTYDRSCIDALVARGEFDAADPYTICEAISSDFAESANEGEVPVTDEAGDIIPGLNKQETYIPDCSATEYACTCNVSHDYYESGSGSWSGSSDNVWTFAPSWQYGGYCSTEQRLVFINDPNQSDARVWSEFVRSSY